MRNFENVGRIKVFIKDPNKKSLLKMTKEVIVLMITKKEIPFYYFKYLYRKDVKNYLDYLSTNEVNAIGHSKWLHKPEYKSLFDNKLFFSLFCEKTSLNTPKLISYNLGNTFFYNNTIKQIWNRNELVIFFEYVFATSNLEGLFFRPPSAFGGKGCFKLSKKNLKNEIEDKFELFINGYYVHTEIIIQHEEINKINNKSVNTLRIISFITPENTIEIINAYIRFGVGNSVVDNVSSGGFWVGINLRDASLNKVGNVAIEYGGGEIYKHPDSGFKFEGFKVPYFKEACEEVIKAVKIIPDRLIGWDIAITPNGPTIVEANKGPHLESIEIANGGLLQNPHIKKLVEELKTNKVN